MTHSQKIGLSDANSVDVFYGRKSTGYKSDQHEEEQSARFGNDRQARSLPKQKRAFEEMYASFPADEKTHKLVIIEEAESGYKPNKREGYDKVIEWADSCGINRLYFNETRRIARNPEECGKIAQRLSDGRIEEIVMLNGRRFQKGDSAQLLLFLIEGGVGWMESADKGKDVSQGMLDKAKEGGSTGWAPIGYRNVAEGKRKYISEDPMAAPKVRHLFVLAATGAYSLEALAVAAKKAGLRTRPTNRHPEGLLPGKTTIHQMLRNPMYKGIKPYKGSLYKGEHEGIVETGLWEQTQLELSRRSTNTDRPQDLSLRELFTMAGCVRCGVCLKRTMSPYNAKGKYVTYECKNRQTKCRNSINQDDLLAQLYKEITQLHFSDDDYELARKTLKKVHESQTKNQRSRREVLEQEYHEADKQVTDVFMRLGEAEKYGIQETISMKLAQLKMRKDEIKEALDRLHDESDEWIDHTLRCFELVKVTRQAIKLGSPEIRQALLKSLCSNFVVRDKKLVSDWLSPFREKLAGGDRTKWLPRLDSNQQPWR